MSMNDVLHQELERLVARDQELIKEGRVILNEAADYIEEHGWNQGAYRDDETGATCALGAIWSVRDSLLDISDPHGLAEGKMQFLADNKGCDKALRLLARHLAGEGEAQAGHQAAMAPHGIHVPNWNDQPDRTAQDVVRALREAARE